MSHATSAAGFYVWIEAEKAGRAQWVGGKQSKEEDDYGIA